MCSQSILFALQYLLQCPLLPTVSSTVVVDRKGQVVALCGSSTASCCSSLLPTPVRTHCPAAAVICDFSPREAAAPSPLLYSVAFQIKDLSNVTRVAPDQM